MGFMQQFNLDKDIMEYIEKGIGSIKLLNECRLYREEQYQITEEVLKVRNSTEWIIRINKVIANFVYAITKSYEYAKVMDNPLEETENSQMYSFYLEDAVYRDIGLWDMFRQLVNEFFECGYDVGEQVNIYSFLKNSSVKRKIGNSEARRLKEYLESEEHQEVRIKLRNQFTHSLDGTSSYIFHRIDNEGKIQADKDGTEFMNTSRLVTIKFFNGIGFVFIVMLIEPKQQISIPVIIHQFLSIEVFTKFF